MKILIIKRQSHFFYFDKLIKSPDIMIYSEIPEIARLSSELYKKSPLTLVQLNERIREKGIENCQVLIPLDNSNSFDIWYSTPELRALPALGISAGVVDTEWVCHLKVDNCKNKLSSLTHLLEGIYTSDFDTELNISDTPICPTGIFVDELTKSSELSQEVLIIPDFGDYESVDSDKWLNDVKQSIEREGLTYKVIEFSSDKASVEQFDALKDAIGASRFVITPRSYIFYLVRAWGVNAIAYDAGRYVSISFDRELNPRAAFIRHKRDFSKIFHYHGPKKLTESLKIGLNGEGALSVLPVLGCVPITKGHVVLWGRMPPHNYSGGRYHGWLLAEGLAALGYKVTVMTDNRPYFIDDFAHLPGHRNIHIQTTADFLDETTHPSYTAEKVLVIPGMDRKGDMYKGAIEYAISCNAKIGLINFESPNWFNAMVFPNRDPELWKYWEVTSKFSSLILSTTEISNRYANEYFVNTSNNCLFQSLYAPINSTHSEKYLTLNQKENRVVVFFPRSGYSAHKGWQNIVDTIGHGFKGHTVVFLCGESDLPETITQQLHSLATEIGFDIEYKVKINDEEKFKELARACLLMFPSQFEGYGYPPLEALSVGTPTVAFDLPVLRETCGEHLIYAPKGDWTSFKHLANSALESNYRLSSDAVERAMHVASFSNFTSSLQLIIDSWSSIKPSEENYTRESIDKAFFDQRTLVVKFNAQRSKTIEAKAIVKSVLYNLQFDPSVDVPLNDSTRVMVALDSSSILDVELGSNSLIDLVTHLNIKNIAVDFICQDFAIETLGDKFKFGVNRFISIGRSEILPPKIRGEVGILLLKLLNQYNYLEVISVDGFLFSELSVLSHAESCPKISYLKSLHSHGSVDFFKNASCYVGENEGTTAKNNIAIPNSILISKDRKDWLINGSNLVLTIVVEEVTSSISRFVASLEYVLQSLQRKGLNLRVKLAAKEPVTSMPYFISFVKYKNNNDLYKLMRQSMFVINLLDTTLSDYLMPLSRLIGVIEIDSAQPLVDTESFIYDLVTNSENWKIVRSKGFNQEVNKVASPNYYSGILLHNGSINKNFLQQYSEKKRTVISKFKVEEPRLFEQFKEKLNSSNVLHASEILKRYSVQSDMYCKSLLIEMLLLAEQTESAELICTELKLQYPGESLGFHLGSKLKFQVKDPTMASQYDYYSLMLDSLNIQSISSAFRSSVNQGRTIDSVIHKTIVKNAVNLEVKGVIKNFTCERQARLYKALVQEYSND